MDASQDLSLLPSTDAELQTDSNKRVFTAVTSSEGATHLSKTPRGEDEAITSSSGQVFVPNSAITREWFVTPAGEARTYHVTVADFTSVCPESPLMVVGVDGRRWKVDIRYGCSAYPLCGPPCSYSWEENGHTFELSLDSMALNSWRRSLVLFCDGCEVTTGNRKPVFWAKRFFGRMLVGALLIAVGVAIQLLIKNWMYGSTSHIHFTLMAIFFVGIVLLTTVIVLPCAIGMSYFIVGCFGTVKFALSMAFGGRRHTMVFPSKHIRWSLPDVTANTKTASYVKIENGQIQDV